MKLTFGQFIKNRRIKLGLSQDEITNFEQPYISKIERGAKNPTKRSTIEELAKALQYSDNDVDWLWMYSLLDYDPREYFASKTPHQIKESGGMYLDSVDEISLDASEQEVLSRLGQPNKKFSLPSKSKWIYEKDGVHIIFAEGRVVDIIFK